MFFGIGKRNEYDYKVGDVVVYAGAYKSKKGLYEIKKRMYQDSKPCYECKSIQTGKVFVFAQNAIKAQDKIKKTATREKVVVKSPIQAIDERAKQIQKKSGIKKVEKVVTYNISRKDAKKMAFREAAKKSKKQ